VGVILFCAVWLTLLPQATGELNHPARAIPDNYVSAWNAGSSGRMAALFDVDAIQTTPDGKTLSGQTAIRQRYEAALSAKPPGSLRVTVTAFRVLAPNVAYASGTFQIEGAQGPEGKESFLIILVKKGEQWLIVAHHAGFVL
jgi:uncharacterized protein (TIGR02246 family)